MSFPVLGTMMNGGLVNGLPVWQQPDGPGTPVYPQQPLGERVALFVMPFCSHWTNHLNVTVEQSAANVQSAILSCPLCSCVVRIMTPASLYQDNTVNFILLP